MKDTINELFKKAATTSGAVGVQLSIIKDGEQLDFAHGFANAELGIEMTEDTIVQIGSTTKVFNAMIIMSLVEERKLDLDVPVRTYIPGFELSDPNATAALTLRHLLSMSSGMDNGDYDDYGWGEDAIAKYVAARRFVPHHFRSGTHYGYSNAGSAVAGYAAECVTAKIWDDLLRERILEPAGLKNTVSLTRDLPYQRVSVGYHLDSESGKINLMRPWSLNRSHAPSGSTLTASAHDLARFGSIFLQKGVADTGARVLSEKSIGVMMTPHTEWPLHPHAAFCCLGPHVTEWNGVMIYEHGGGAQSGGCALHWIPEKNGVIAWTINTGTSSVRSRFEKIMVQEIMKAVFEVSAPEIKAPTMIESVDTTRYVGTYEEQIRQHQVEVVDGKLIRTTKWAEYRPTWLKAVETVSLIPIGGDRFLIDKGMDTDPERPPAYAVFFGDDGHGHVANMLYLPFPTTRTS